MATIYAHEMYNKNGLKKRYLNKETIAIYANEVYIKNTIKYYYI